MIYKGGKDSSIVIVDKRDSFSEFNKLRRDKKEVYKTATDFTLDSLRKFQSFFVKVLKNLSMIKWGQKAINQLGYMVLLKYIFDNINDIMFTSTKFQPIIDSTAFYTEYPAQIISN